MLKIENDKVTLKGVIRNDWDNSETEVNLLEDFIVIRRIHIRGDYLLLEVYNKVAENVIIINHIATDSAEMDLGEHEKDFVEDGCDTLANTQPF